MKSKKEIQVKVFNSHKSKLMMLMKKIHQTNLNKSGSQNDILAKILKKCVISTAPILQNCFNDI